MPLIFRTAAVLTAILAVGFVALIAHRDATATPTARRIGSAVAAVCALVLFVSAAGAWLYAGTI